MLRASPRATPLATSARWSVRPLPLAPLVARRAPVTRVGGSSSVGSSVSPANRPITITENALKHLNALRDESGRKTLLRMGVKSGGCGGMSYVMDFEEEGNVKKEDIVMEYDDGFTLVCDPKSLLYLFGLHLDYSNQLVGGGFVFRNPNASSTCGCGKSFGI